MGQIWHKFLAAGKFQSALKQPFACRQEQPKAILCPPRIVEALVVLNSLDTQSVQNIVMQPYLTLPHARNCPAPPYRLSEFTPLHLWKMWQCNFARMKVESSFARSGKQKRQKALITDIMNWLNKITKNCPKLFVFVKRETLNYEGTGNQLLCVVPRASVRRSHLLIIIIIHNNREVCSVLTY